MKNTHAYFDGVPQDCTLLKAPDAHQQLTHQLQFEWGQYTRKGSTAQFKKRPMQCVEAHILHAGLIEGTMEVLWFVG